MKNHLLKLNLRLFDAVTPNATTDPGMSVEMKTFYDKDLLENAAPNLVHDQFAQTRDIPSHGGNTIEFRRFEPLPKAMTPLVEGVTPDGKKLTVTKITSTVQQYGDYVPLTDRVQTETIDNVLLETNQLLGQQAGLTLDTVTREVINAGTSVYYCGDKTLRSNLTIEDTLKVADVDYIVAVLKGQNVPKIDGRYYGAIAHPHVLYDLKRDPEWQDVRNYAAPEERLTGETGMYNGVRFVETSEAKIFEKAAGSGTLNVYSTLFVGANAYATTKTADGGLRMIVKQLGSAGSADPLDQRGSAGWKAIKTAEILTQTYMIRCESCSKFSLVTD